MKSHDPSLRSSAGAVSPEHIQRLAAIPLLFTDGDPAPTRYAKVAEDSWRNTSPIGRRDLVDGCLRRVTFAAGGYRVELVAERRDNKWEFVGRVYYQGRARYDVILAVGRKRVAPDSGGFFHWSSPQATRNLALLSDAKQIALEPIRW